MSDTVSVIIPVYGVEQYLARCVTSIREQTYTALDILLVDDGSKDSCGILCDEYTITDERIRVIHQPNGGLSDARNTGIEAATGKYLLFVDSDDYLEPNSIELLYTALSEDKSDIAIGSHRAVYESGTVLDKSTGERTVLEPKEVLRRILYDDGIDLSAWAKLYKKSIFSDVRFPKGRLFEDAATTYKLIDRAEKLSVHSVATYNYMIRTNSITGTRFSPRKMDLITSTKEMCDYVVAKYPDLQAAAERRLMYAYLSTLSQLAMSKEPFPEEQKILMDYVRKNGGKLLKDSSLPKRDKLGILAAKPGFWFYKFMWKMYYRLTGRA